MLSINLYNTDLVLCLNSMTQADIWHSLGEAVLTEAGILLQISEPVIAPGNAASQETVKFAHFEGFIITENSLSTGKGFYVKSFKMRFKMWL